VAPKPATKHFFLPRERFPAGLRIHLTATFTPAAAAETEASLMATVDRPRTYRDDFEDSTCLDPFAVADSGHSEPVRAEADCLAQARSHSRAEVQARQATRPGRRLHRIAIVRQRQGVTLRNVARRLGVELATIRRQEQPDYDLRVSDLQRWQEVLEVPMAELLEEGDGQLSGPVLERSRMVKLMKTAAAIRERTSGTPVGRIVSMLVEQILEIMPELEDVTPWHTVGQRRTLDDVGRTARHIVPEDIFRRGS
jgi:transcriptional regulator with XRE-family HTH domain